MTTMMRTIVASLLGCEAGQKQNDYVLLLALITFATVVILLVLGPQMTIVYAQAGTIGR